MGAFDDHEPLVIPRTPEEAKAWGWEPHEQVILKGVIDVSDQEYVTNQYGKSDKKGNVEIKMGGGRFALLDRMIISWTFTRNGQAVPLSASMIRKLPAVYSNNILSVIDEIAGGTMDEEAQTDFLPVANAPIVDSSSSESLPQTTS